MYDQIASNKRRTVFLFMIVIVLYALVGWALAQVYNNQLFLVLALVVSSVQVWLSYYYSDKVALFSVGAKGPIKKSEAPAVYRAVENMAITAGVPMPKVYLIPTGGMNALATGRDPKHASIAITTGLADQLSKSELEGVVAHEMSHIKNRDILVMTVTVILIGALSILSNIFMRSLWWGGGRRDNNDNGGGNILAIVGIALIVLAPIIGLFIQLAISRKREYLADASGALLTRYPEGLARALEKIANDKRPMETASSATAHLFIANPFKSSGMTNLFSTHPPIKDRIKCLRAMVK
jgi:heat shock protein HtpX